MRLIANLISWTGDYLLNLSDGARKAIVLGLLLLLGEGSIYKLVIGLENLRKPLPAATPEQLIEPMEQLFKKTSQNVDQYQLTRKQDMHRLDSLAKHYSSKNSTN